MMAIARSGKKTGPGRLRSTASSSASARMNTSATRKYSMLRTKARAMSGTERANSSPLKKACSTAGQFAECTTAHHIANATTTVLATAMATPAAPSLRPVLPRMRDRRPASTRAGLGAPGTVPVGSRELTPTVVELGGAEDRHRAHVRLLGEPRVLDLLERPRGPQRRQRLVHAGHQRVPLLERHRRVVGSARGRRELRHHRAVLDLLDVRVGDVQRGGQVHDQ